MTDDTRLAEIEAQVNADAEVGYISDLPCVEDRRWLVARIRALEAQAAMDALLKVTVLGRRQLEKMLYEWQDAHQRDEWGHVYALMSGEVQRARELEDAVLDADLAACDAGGKGEDTSDRPMPINWPEGRPLPTEEQARQAVRNAQEMLDRLLEESRKKLPTSAPTRQFTR
jgi:hypothetical protein